MDKHADIVEDRILGIENDLRTFVDLRTHNRQHRNNDHNDDIGGGNIVMALSLFAVLGLLSKVYVCITSNEASKYDSYFNEHGHAKDEQKLFVEYAKFLGNGYDLFETDDPSNRTLKGVWECFRDFTTHLLVPDQGNIIITYSWETAPGKPVNDVLADIRANHGIRAFERKDTGWLVNVDKLLSVLPEIKTVTATFMREHVANCGSDCSDKVDKILWR